MAQRRAAAGKARRRKGAGLARPGLHRADLPWSSARSCWSSGPSLLQGAARSSRPSAPRRPTRRRPRGTSSACRKCSSTSIRGWPASCCRRMIIVGLMAMPYIDFNQKGNGYYTFDAAQVRDHHVPVRLPGAVGGADRAGHVPARAELELLRPVRVLGPAQGRAAEQRQPVGLSSG